MLLDHAIGEKRHILEIKQALSAQLRLISLDESRQFRIAPTPLGPRAIDVALALLGRELPPPVGIVGAVDGVPVCHLHGRPRFQSRRDPEIRRKARGHAADIRTDHLAQRKAVHRPDEGAISRSHAEARKTSFEFDRTLVIVGDTGNASRFDHVLRQNPRHSCRQGFGLPASRPSQHDTMPGFNDRGRLFRVRLELSQGLTKRAITRHEQSVQRPR